MRELSRTNPTSHMAHGRSKGSGSVFHMAHHGHGSEHGAKSSGEDDEEKVAKPRAKKTKRLKEQRVDGAKVVKRRNNDENDDRPLAPLGDYGRSSGKAGGGPRFASQAAAPQGLTAKQAIERSWGGRRPKAPKDEAEEEQPPPKAGAGPIEDYQALADAEADAAAQAEVPRAAPQVFLLLAFCMI